MNSSIPGLTDITEEENEDGSSTFHFDVEDDKVDEFFSTFGLETNDTAGFQRVVNESLSRMLDAYENNEISIKSSLNECIESVVEHPSHYRSDSGFEAIDVIEAWNLGFNLGNALKYISRAGLKDKNREIEDLEKAQWYLNREIERIKKSK